MKYFPYIKYNYCFSRFPIENYFGFNNNFMDIQLSNCPIRDKIYLNTHYNQINSYKPYNLLYIISMIPSLYIIQYHITKYQIN